MSEGPSTQGPDLEGADVEDSYVEDLVGAEEPGQADVFGQPGPGDDLDDQAGNRRPGGLARTVLDYLARALVDDPEAVVIEADQDPRGSSGRRGGAQGRAPEPDLVLRLHVAPQDMGRVIGRRGRMAQAIRTLVRAAGARDGVEATVDIVD